MNPAAVPRPALERIALGILLLAAGFLVVHDIAIVAFPHDLIYGEGYLLRDAAMLRAGRSPYTPLAPPPAVVANYPPVYPLAFALATIPLGVGLLAGRLISVLATVGCAWLLLRIARRALGPGGRAAAGFFAPLLFLADLVVYYWSPYARVDMLALCFELAALDAYHAALAAADGGERASFRRGRAFAVLAIFTRPTAVAALAAIVVLLVLARRGREAAREAALTAGAVGIIGLALSLATGGQFLAHTIADNANAFRWGELPRLLIDFATVHAPLLLGAAAYFVAGRAAEPRPPGDRLLALFFAFAACGALLVGKVGSSVNYFLEAVAAGALLFGIALARSEGAHRRLLLVMAAAAPLLATTVPWVPSLELRLNPFPAMGRTPGAEDRRVGDAVAQIVATTPGEVLIEDAGFAVRAGKTVWAHPLVLSYLEVEGRYDPAPLAEMIKRREFSLIVLSYNFLSPSLRAAVGEAYRPDRMIEIRGRFKYVILRPAAG